MYGLMKSLHMLTAIATILGFVLRGYWMMIESDKLQLKITRIAPHIIDTIFLLSAIAMVMMLNLNVLSQPWLLAKITGLVVYIVLGTVAIKRGRTKQGRVIAFASALAVFAYVVGVAISKSPASWLTLLAA